MRWCWAPIAWAVAEGELMRHEVCYIVFGGFGDSKIDLRDWYVGIGNVYFCVEEERWEGICVYILQ